MYVKSLGFVFGLAISLMTSNGFAQGRTAPEFIENIDPSALPNGSIVILKTEETDAPGYMHTKYALVDHLCGAVLVDHYGPPVNSDDKELKQAEQRMCMEIATNSRDGE
jgi:hypothetical protein